MDLEMGTIEERLKSFNGQLQAESAVLERMVYKNKNQHRRCSYFQYLLKVRRDLKLLKSAKLDELLTSCFEVISGAKPKQKFYRLESLKRTKCEKGKYNFMERLLGASRLLSQMVELILKAATEVSILLAQSFFTGFSVIMLALLARLRILVQQILLDVVSVFNTVSTLSQQKQSVKLFEDGIEAYAEYYPTNVEFLTLECVWKRDKFILLEQKHKGQNKNQDENFAKTLLLKASVNYETIESFLGDDEIGSDKAQADDTIKKCIDDTKEDETKAVKSSSMQIDNKEQMDNCKLVENVSDVAGAVEIFSSADEGLLASSNSPSCTNSSIPESRKRKVAFISVKAPSSSATNTMVLQPQEIENNSDDKAGSFFSLLTVGNLKDSLL